MLRLANISLVACLFVAACGGGDASNDGGGAGPSSTSTTAASGTGSGGSGGGGGESASVASSSSSTSGSGSGGGATGSGGAGEGGAGEGGQGQGGSLPVGLPTLGSLVVLGDSISDGGGQSPFYYDLLKDDLQAKYGAITYKNKANSGSKTDDLVNQVNSLPNSLPGPVAVTITSGGNDMKAAIALVLTGTDGAKKQAMSDNIDAALSILLTPNHFGQGVEVYVFEGNIYDASDGAGDFGSHGCAFGQGIPAFPSDVYFDAWNQVIADAVAAHGQTSADMHTFFYGHGYSNPPSWYASDCTHPSSLGHDMLHQLFYTLITGEAAP